MTLARATVVTLATALTAAVVLVAAGPAHAASEYRWWSYWFIGPGGASWTYAGIGPASHRVDDGMVEGWRFVVAVPNPSAPAPRTSAATAFESICGSTPRPQDMDRVALVVDFGTTADAPKGERPPTTSVRGTCVVVPDRSSGLTVLQEAGYSVRLASSGLTCGLQGYPRRECGVVVDDTPDPTPSATKSGLPSPSRSSEKSPETRSPDVVQPSEGATQPPDATASPPGSTPSPGPDGSTAPTPVGSPSASEVSLEVGAPPTDSGGGGRTGPLGMLAGLAVLLLIAGAALWRSRTRRSTR